MTSSNQFSSITNRNQSSWLQKRQCEEKFLRVCSSFGYVYQDLPLIAPTELFLRKSGGELASQMLSMVDVSSNLISLRPECTALIMSQYLKSKDSFNEIARIQYSGPVFRQPSTSSPEQQSFTQLGAEIIGLDSPIADTELLSLAAQILTELGISDYQIRVADLQVVNSIVDSVGLSDRARNFVISCIPLMKLHKSTPSDLLKQAEYLNIIGENVTDNKLNLAISGLDDQQAKTVLHGFLQWSEGTSPNLGQRDPDDVIDRLLKKLRGSNEQQNLEKALDLIDRLVNLEGTAADTLQNTSLILSEAGAGPSSLQSLQRLVDLTVDDIHLSSGIALDFGLIKGIAYYSGLVFDIVHVPTSTILAGGGRYDSLAQDLGSDSSVPAAGFAYDLDALQALLQPGNGSSPRNIYELFSWDDSVLVIPKNIHSQAMALRVAQEYRNEGLRVEIGYQYQNVSEAIKDMDAATWDRIIVVGPSGVETSSESTTPGS